MSATQTPGQVAYGAYVTAVEGRPVPPATCATMWARLLPHEQRAWEAVAQAVLAHCTPQEDPP